MNLDESTAKLLVSEALKDQLDLPGENDPEDLPELLAEIFIEVKNQKFSISGLLTSLTKDNDTVVIQNRVSVTDAHEIFSLLDEKFDAICPGYSLSLFDKTFSSDGPFKVLLRSIDNINYKTSQCAICFELVRIKP